MSLDHANHNTDLCDKLLNEGIYLDWVVTTAFYAAMHYIDAKIYPVKYKGIEYIDFATFYKVICKPSGISKHNGKIILSTGHSNDLGEKYRYLHDACHSARYSRYLVSQGAAAHARKKLSKINTII